MVRKRYSCDFETTTDPNDCRVWAYGWMEIGNTNNYEIGNSMDTFMAWVKKVKADLYFHNLKFDGSFIVNWLLKNGFRWSEENEPNTFKTVISRMGQWYMIDICYGYAGKKKLHTVIYDSLKKLPFKVAQIAKGFKLKMLKGDIDYHTYRPVGHEITDEEYQYILNDIQIVAEALHVQFQQGLEKMTAGSDSLKGFKDTLAKKHYDKMFPVFDLHLDKQLRRAYRGGFTWLNDKYAGVDIGTGIVFDVNSLYPSQMYTRDLPYGVPLPFDGEYEYDPDFPLYIQHFTFEFELKEGYIPIIQIKGNAHFRANEYQKDSRGLRVEMWATNVDLELYKEHYHIYDIEYHDGFKFRKRTGVFKNFIDKWTKVKQTETGAKKQLAKLMLNSLYGKFATNPDVTGKIPRLNDDGSLSFVLGAEESRDPVYTPMGAFITAWARYTTITAAQKCFDRIIYCDTDSIHLIGEEIPDVIKDIVDDKELGYWAHESTYRRARYLRQKTYIQDICGKEIEVDGEKVFINTSLKDAETYKLSVKCAGMNDKIKKGVTFENFHIGFKSLGSLKPKQVNNGVVLIDSVFSIK